MILRKPYAFLIKYFRIIHIVMTLISFYILNKSYHLYNFFNEYVTNKYSLGVYTGFADSYITPFIYIFIIINILIYILIIFLFKSKKKPSRYYELSLIYYIIALFIFIITKNILITFESSVIEAELARIYRDVSFIFIIPQIPILLASFIRALGFNIKKFNFEQDLKDLNITEKDDEEVELSLNYETYKIVRIIRRFVREFIYYIKENTFMFICICSIILLVCTILLVNSNKSYDNVYKQNEAFMYNNLSINIKDSIITNLAYNGDVIDSHYYLVLQTIIENTNDYDIEFNSSDLKLLINDNYLYPTNDKSIYFTDYGKEFFDGKIKRNSKKTYAIVYTLNEEELKNSYKINIYKGTMSTKKKIFSTYNIIKINPIKMIEKVVVSNNKIGDNVTFANSNLLNTKVKINNFSILKKFVYDYEVCITSSDCRKFKDYVNISSSNTNKQLLILDINCTLDKKAPFYLTISKDSTFVEKFGKLIYINDDGEFYSDLVNVTPDKLQNRLIFEVDGNIKTTDKLKFAFIVRNKEYQISLN